MSYSFDPRCQQVAEQQQNRKHSCSSTVIGPQLKRTTSSCTRCHSEFPATIPFRLPVTDETEIKQQRKQADEIYDRSIPSSHCLLTYQAVEFERTLRILGYQYDAKWNPDWSDESIDFYCYVMETSGEYRTVRDWWLVVNVDPQTNHARLLRVILARSPHELHVPALNDTQIARSHYRRLAARINFRLSGDRNLLLSMQVDHPGILWRINRHITQAEATMFDWLK